MLELNEGAVPHVNSLSAEVLRELGEQAFYFRMARTDQGRVAGFLLALAESAVYGSPNFTWFQARYERFAYIDRVVVDPAFRRAGIARRLYEDLEREAASREWLTCEVNLRPPNPGSIEFHQRLGFREVGQQDTEGGAKRVALLAKRLAPAPGGER